MGISISRGLPNPRGLLRGLLGWTVSALILLLIGTAVFQWCSLDACRLGYFSSAVSFLAAFAFGSLIGKGAESIWTKGLFGGLLLSIVLLTIGWLMSGKSLPVDGVVSTGCFSVAGAFAGHILISGNRNGRGQRRRSMARVRSR